MEIFFTGIGRVPVPIFHYWRVCRYQNQARRKLTECGTWQVSRDNNFVNYDGDRSVSIDLKHGTLVTLSFDYVLLIILVFSWKVFSFFSSHFHRKLDKCPVSIADILATVCSLPQTRPICIAKRKCSVSFGNYW